MFNTITNHVSRFAKRIVPALAVLAFSGTYAFATPVVDQSNTGPLDVGYCSGNCEWQQTIMAGLTGKLTGVKLFGSGTGEVRIGLGSGFYTGPWAADIQNAAIGTTIDLSSYNIFVTAGQKFVIDTWHITGGLQGTNTTPVQQLYLDWAQVGIHASPYNNYGLGYVTYVDTAAAAVPEPSMLALFALALFGLAMARRRKQ